VGVPVGIILAVNHAGAGLGALAGQDYQIMKITCLDKQVGQFLKESFYRIPRFQRPYSWGDRTNIEEFWNDAVVENEAQYFIGSFVVYDDKSALGLSIDTSTNQWLESGTKTNLRFAILCAQ
jgi:hypothetical protein